MSNVHTIRLRGPWEYEPLSRGGLGDLPASGRAQMPCDWSSILGVDFRGRVYFRRRFNRPGQLDPHEQVWLVIEHQAELLGIRLNDQPLNCLVDNAQQVACEITGQLASHNELRIELSRDTAESANWLSEVRLEIRS
ncbi:MAG: hypothetical protein JNM18_19960 [Planctomycetaceae bacterium]|nr:hypothetical protein [Planctomycetaceae bacterium]